MKQKKDLFIIIIFLIVVQSNLLFSQETLVSDEVATISEEKEAVVTDTTATTDIATPQEDVNEESIPESFESDNESEVTDDNTTTVSEETSDTSSETSIITIEHALKTTYMQDDEKGTDTIRFEGDVIVSVESGNTKTTIYSDYIDFDRKRNSLYAEGNVLMEQRTNGEVTERLSAESLLFNTSTLEGFFNQGRVVQEQQESLNLTGDSVLIVSSELFAKGSSNAVTFKNGNLTFCNDENPHWQINASRIWLLPGNEFAFLNALLFVGPVPVMYFPFFYYPKDELVFNPAFGFRSREGFFVQTTTYIIGRKPLNPSNDSDDENDIGFNFMQQSQLKEQELQGLVLRNLDENATMTPDYLKIMADYYTALGGMVGVEGNFEPNNVFSNIQFDARLGFSNVVFKIDDFPLYISYENDIRYPDYGWFFGNKLPFRYAASFNTDISIENVRLSVDIPLYSDPWFDSDFSDRQESMDWIDFFLSGALLAPPEEDDDDDDNEVTGFTWDITASYRPSIPAIKPWVSDISISTINSAVVFDDQNAPSTDFETSIVQQNSPNRKFFYPSQVKPIALKTNISGTLIDWGSDNQIEVELEDNSSNEISDELKNILALMSTPENLQHKSIIEDNNGENSDEESEENESILQDELLPDVETKVSVAETTSNATYKLTYSIAPEVSTLHTYSATIPQGSEAISPSDININDPKSGQVYFRSPVNVTGTFSAFSSLLSIKNTFNFTPEYQYHYILSDNYYTEQEKDNIVLNDFENQVLDLTNTNTVSVKPLIDFTMFNNTSLNWNTNVKLIRTEFIGTKDEPQWEYKAPEWDEDSIITHNLNASFEAKQNDFYQRLTLETNLPPLVDRYTGTVTLGFPFITVTGKTGYEKESLTSEEWNFQPFNQTSKIVFFENNADGSSNENKLTLSQSYEYDIDEETSENLSVSLAWRGLQFSYTMKNEFDYTLDLESGWISSEEESFSPYSLAFTWNVNNFEIKNSADTLSIKPGLSTSLSWDMVIPTRSYFSFKPSLSIEINNFLSLTFSSESRNEQIARYIQDVIAFTPEIPGERNIFIDLFNSFAFADEAKRQSSGFKIENFNLAIEHDLHDWTLKSEFSIEPRIVSESDGSQYFDYSPYFTLSILWKPMSGIKTTIEDDYGEFTLNP